MLNIKFEFKFVLLIDIHPLVQVPQIHPHSFGSILVEQTALLWKSKPFQLLLYFDWHYCFPLQFEWLVANFIEFKLEHVCLCQWDGGAVGNYEHILVGSRCQILPITTYIVQLIPKEIEYSDIAGADDGSPGVAHNDIIDAVIVITSELPLGHEGVLGGSLVSFVLAAMVGFHFEECLWGGCVHEDVVSNGEVVEQSLPWGEFDASYFELIMVLELHHLVLLINASDNAAVLVVEHELQIHMHLVVGL